MGCIEVRGFARLFVTFWLISNRKKALKAQYFADLRACLLPILLTILIGIC